MSWLDSGWISWNGTGSPVSSQSQRSAPVVEVEIGLGLDEAAERTSWVLIDDDLVLVDPGQHAVGPAPGHLEQHLLAGDSGAALHGADRVPGGRDRGAGQDVVELGEQEVVPGGVDPGEAGVALGRVGAEGRGGGFGLVEQLLAMALGGLMSCITL